MNEKYEEVPTIISTKDLSYLSDMFCWNYIAVKQANHYLNQTKDKQTQELFNEVKQVHMTNLNIITDLLDEKGRIYE